jgi:hypothetical protein
MIVDQFDPFGSIPVHWAGFQATKNIVEIEDTFTLGCPMNVQQTNFLPDPIAKYALLIKKIRGIGQDRNGVRGGRGDRLVDVKAMGDSLAITGLSLQGYGAFLAIS